MQFITGNNRHQSFFSTFEQQVSAYNPVRLIDAFIDKPDLEKMSFTITMHKSEGCPPYAPALLLKLYLYGYPDKIRSSSKLERECPPVLNDTFGRAAEIKSWSGCCKTTTAIL